MDAKELRRIAREEAAAAKKAAKAEANQRIREADRRAAWARKYGTDEQLDEAQSIGDAWRQWKDQI